MQDILGMVGCTCYRSSKVHKFEYNPWRCIWHETIRVFAKPKEIFRFFGLTHGQHCKALSDCTSSNCIKVLFRDVSPQSVTQNDVNVRNVTLMMGWNMCTGTRIKHVYQGVQGACPRQAVTCAKGTAERQRVPCRRHGSKACLYIKTWRAQH